MFPVLLIILIIVIDLCSKDSTLRGKDPYKYDGNPWNFKKKKK